MSKPLRLEVLGGTYAPQAVRHVAQAGALAGLIGDVVKIRHEYGRTADNKARTEFDTALNFTEQLAMAGRGLMAYLIYDGEKAVGVTMAAIGGKVGGDDRRPAVYMQSWLDKPTRFSADQIMGLGAEMYERHRNASDLLPNGSKTELIVNESDVLATGIKAYFEQRNEAMGIELGPQPTSRSGEDYPISYVGTANPTSFFANAVPQDQILVVKPYSNLG